MLTKLNHVGKNKGLLVLGASSKEQPILHGSRVVLVNFRGVSKVHNKKKLDEPTNLLLKDAAHNSIAPMCRRLADTGSGDREHENSVTRRHQMPISEQQKERPVSTEAVLHC